MGLKEILLKRLAKHNSSKNPPNQLPQSLSGDEKIRLVFDLVDQTVLPREILLSSDKTEIKILAAEKRLYFVSCAANGKLVFKHKVANAPITPFDSGALVSDLIGAFADSGPFEISFSNVEPPQNIAAGLDLSNLLSALAATREAAPAPAPILTLAPKISAVETSENSGVPRRFLAAMDGEIRNGREWERATGLQTDNSDFTGLDALYANLAPALGQELLFVVLAQGAEVDAFAFALNGAEGVAMEIDRQKIGLAYLTWQNNVPQNP